MTVKEAKKIIREDPHGNIMQRIEAMMIAEKELGEHYTAGDLYKWAEDDNVEDN